MIWIPSIGLEQPIVIGLTNETLLYGGVAMYPQRQLATDNFVLFGQHVGLSDLLFGRLTDMKVNDQLVVKYLEEEIAYGVSDMTVVDETENAVYEMTETAQLTLITYPVSQQAKQRLVIRAHPLEERLQDEVVRRILKSDVESEQRRNQTPERIQQKIYKFPQLALMLSLVLIGSIRILFFIMGRHKDSCVRNSP
ncbi:class A sortase [Enterococcus sp. AZ194]|uniref:class A sortase n=1 Tax=Enterococcus sp. AZ194 TaxID=2774629 RepID=UPI003F682FEA